ncbi:MAG: hypothetical protein ABEN55_21630 [Bradymonadaceae bacterium]
MDDIERRMELERAQEKVHNQKFDFFDQAEDARKDGDVKTAEGLYLKAIEICEDDPIAELDPVPPAPYASLAKMLYHRGQQKEPVSVLKRYEGFEQEQGREPADHMKQLRVRIENKKMKRQPWRYE